MKVQFESYYGKSKRPKKKAKFAITINEQGRTAYYIKKLKYYLKETYPFLKEECALYREKSLKAAKPGDIIVFGNHKKHDYTVVSPESFFEDPRISDTLHVIDLESGFKLVKKAITRYVVKNYPEKAPLKKKSYEHHHCRTTGRATVLLGIRPIVTTTRYVTRSYPVRPVRVVAPPRRRKTDWNIQVNNSYVLLTDGSRYETRKITRCGNRETVSIDGTRYTVRRDSMGRGLLV